jgi:hypothetical protein
VWCVKNDVCVYADVCTLPTTHIDTDMLPIIDFTQVKPSEETEHWAYYPRLLDCVSYRNVACQIIPNCVEYNNTMYGKVFPARRISCVAGFPAYGELRNITWDSIPIVSELKGLIDKKLMPECGYAFTAKAGQIIDPRVYYALIHVYRTGHDMIGFHADREAKNTPVISVTFCPEGVVRKFQLRPIKDKSGYTKEFLLGHGDVFVMKAGCQTAYKHAIPEQRGMNQERINLTFRYHNGGKMNPTKTTQSGWNLSNSSSSSNPVIHKIPINSLKLKIKNKD